MPKPPFSSAPDFTLPCASGTFRLNDLEGRKRVALLFARSDDDARDAISQLETNREAWKERDLVLVLVMRNEMQLKAPQNVCIVRDENGEVAQQFGVSDGETAFFLLGKSRFPVAMAVNYFPDDAEIFALIDAMPMRRAEMSQRAK